MIKGYKPFLIKKLKEGSSVIDSSKWNIYVKHVPFQIAGEVKNVNTETWFDENGDDEFVPNSLLYKAYEMVCEFVFIGTHGTANAKINEFISYLTKDGVFSIYDTYTNIGRTNVRLSKGVDNPSVMYRKDGENDIVVFSVSLKVNDPITEIKLTNDNSIL